MTDFSRLMSKAKIGLLSKEELIFFTTVILGARHLVDNTAPTAYTNGLDCYYNEEFFAKLDPSEREFLVAHEGMHIILEHCTERAMGMDPDRWNRAGDYIINQMLIDIGLKMPKGGLHDPKYKNHSTMQVYRLLEQDEQGGSGPGPGNQMGGQSLNDIREPQGNDQSKQREAIKQHVEELVMRGKTMAEMAGKMPGTLGPDLDRLLDKILKPAIPWQRVLRRHLHATIKNDFTWAFPNRRYQHLGMYLPSQKSPGLGPVTFAWDTSGSITDPIFNFFVSETHHVLKRFTPDYIEVMQFDHTLRSKDRVKSLKALLNLEMKGGGGTVIDEALESYRKSDSRVLIVLTDGYIHRLHQLRDPRKPVIWAVYDNPKFTAPFGAVVKFKMPDGD